MKRKVNVGLIGAGRIGRRQVDDRPRPSVRRGRDRTSKRYLFPEMTMKDMEERLKKCDLIILPLARAKRTGDMHPMAKIPFGNPYGGVGGPAHAPSPRCSGIVRTPTTTRE